MERHSLNARYAHWHTGQQQRISTATKDLPGHLLATRGIVSIVCRHGFVGLPRLLLPFGVQWSAIFETVSLSLK